jgi:tRNA(Ser,Leu) C12 N-acetylase TAN1
MKDWNVVLTSHMGEEHRLLKEIADYGDFQAAGFREVIIGKVPDPAEFLEILKHSWETQPFLSGMLSTATPVHRLFSFPTEELMDRLRQESLAFLPRLEGKAFYVRVKRRGHKGEISSQEVEQALDRFLLDELAARGQPGRIDFDSPDVMLFVEILHNQCGLTLITPEMKQRYPFIKVK